MFYSTHYSSPLGEVLLVSDGNNLIGLWYEGQKYYATTINEETINKSDLSVFKITKKWLDRYFNGEKPNISELPLSPKGSEFRKVVWDILCKIPYGKTITYGEIAEIVAGKIGKKRMSSRAVGGAVGHNPISIIIPCHRVVGKNGNLTGYASGINRKVKLLELEKIDVSHFFEPAKNIKL